jgi:hypothetical protein
VDLGGNIFGSYMPNKDYAYKNNCLKMYDVNFCTTKLDVPNQKPVQLTQAQDLEQNKSCASNNMCGGKYGDKNMNVSFPKMSDLNTYFNEKSLKYSENTSFSAKQSTLHPSVDVDLNRYKSLVAEKNNLFVTTNNKGNNLKLETFSDIYSMSNQNNPSVVESYSSLRCVGTDCLDWRTKNKVNPLLAKQKSVFDKQISMYSNTSQIQSLTMDASNNSNILNLNEIIYKKLDNTVEPSKYLITPSIELYGGFGIKNSSKSQMPKYLFIS